MLKTVEAIHDSINPWNHWSDEKDNRICCPNRQTSFFFFGRDRLVEVEVQHLYYHDDCITGRGIRLDEETIFTFTIGHCTKFTNKNTNVS